MGLLINESGSFRDPANAVIYLDGRVLRGLDTSAGEDFSLFSATKSFESLSDTGKIIGTRELSDDEVPAEIAGKFSAVLEHQRVPFISYPYEWSFSMLQDAGALHLEILLACLEDGVSMKDGYSFNLQFLGVKPVFIDIGSFEPAPAGPWIGYRQFCQTILYPLMLEAHLDIPFQRTLMGHLEGITPGEMNRLLRGTRKYRKGVMRNVTLQAATDRRFDRGGRKTQEDLGKSGFGAELNKALAKKLLKTVSGLTSDRADSGWSAYRSTCSYSEEDREAKERFVSDAASAGEIGVAWDLGANDGAYSRLIAKHAKQVIAVDYDDVTVDAMYRSFKADGITNILPIVMNLVDPSPARGWRGTERKAFTDRGKPDLVLALALVHHMALAANVPLAQIVDWFGDLGGRLIVEFVEPHDPMAERLLGNKEAGMFPHYRIEEFERLLGLRFEITSRLKLPSGRRTLYVCHPN
ncbi:MAG: class I SAM-dependent methyltransferase [Actinomycetes bacterium]